MCSAPAHGRFGPGDLRQDDMGPIKRSTGWIYASAAAAAGGAVAIVIVRSLSIEPQAPSRIAQGSLAIETQIDPADRLAFVPRGTFAPPLSSAEDLNVSSVEPEPKPSFGGGWSTATVTEPSVESGWRAILSAPATGPLPAAKREPPRRVYTLKSRLAEIAIPAAARLSSKFQAANAEWPPAQITLLALKDEKVLELHVRQSGGPWKLVHRYKVLAASGQGGPKLRQGDKQVPEGIYAIESLNPNSAYHVSLRVNYPNTFDRSMASKDGRKELGGDIMIHGKDLSAGCLAIGDESVEELFVLAAQIGVPNVKLIIAPHDFRSRTPPARTADQPEWLPKLYADVQSAMVEYPAPKASPSLLSFFFK